MWQNLKTQIATKLKTQIGTKHKKLKLWQNSKLNFDKTQKLNLWQNSKTQKVTKLKKSNNVSFLLPFLGRTTWHLKSQWDISWPAFCNHVMFTGAYNKYVV